jgi:hypothetical protein
MLRWRAASGMTNAAAGITDRKAIMKAAAMTAAMRGDTIVQAAGMRCAATICHA